MFLLSLEKDQKVGGLLGAVREQQGHPLGIRDLCIEHSASGQPQAFQGFPVAQPWLGGSRAMRSKRPGTLRPLVTKL